MRKCKIIISDINNIKELIISDGKNICTLNGKPCDTDNKLLLCKIEDIIFAIEKKQPKEIFTVDGKNIEIYFQKDNNQKTYKITPLEYPQESTKIFKIIEDLYE